MGEEEKVRKLAELKAYVQRRTHELEEELLKLRSLGDLVDVALAEKSFRRVQVPKSQPSTVPTGPAAQPSPPQPAASPASTQSLSIRAASGVDLADLQIDRNEIRVIPKANMTLDPNSPPLRAFLIGRVLEPMRSKDASAVQAGQITEDKAVSYRVEQDGNVLRQIIITNYGDEKRLQELRSAISWTLRRMHEKMTGAQ